MDNLKVVMFLVSSLIILTKEYGGGKREKKCLIRITQNVTIKKVDTLLSQLDAISSLCLLESFQTFYGSLWTAILTEAKRF